jgi:hypothetical protein
MQLTILVSDKSELACLADSHAAQLIWEKKEAWSVSSLQAARCAKPYFSYTNSLPHILNENHHYHFNNFFFLNNCSIFNGWRARNSFTSESCISIFNVNFYSCEKRNWNISSYYCNYTNPNIFAYFNQKAELEIYYSWTSHFGCNYLLKPSV